MKVAAVTRFKQGDLYRALHELGWTQAELARRAGISPGDVGSIINMAKRPSARLAVKIAQALAVAGIQVNLDKLWPPEFKGIGTAPKEVVQYREVQMERLGSPSRVELLEMRDELQPLLDSLTDREKFVIDEIFIKGKPASKVARELGLCGQTVRDMKKRIVGKMEEAARMKEVKNRVEENQ